MTDRYAVIGNPVAHSRSPWIHAEFARACVQDIEYTRIEAPLGRFAEAVDSFRAAGGKGLNVTLPFKGDAFRYCTRPSERARAARAVNTLAFGDEVRGETTDGPGLVADVERNLDFPLRGRRVLLMGAGGAAQGVVAALLEARVASLVIANRTPGKAQELAGRFAGTTGSGYGALEGQAFDLIVNATSSGLSGDAIALPAGVMHREVLAYDMVYGRETPFMESARKAGARVSDGLGMLVEQAAESFRIWRGMRPETGDVLRRLRNGAA